MLLAFVYSLIGDVFVLCQKETTAADLLVWGYLFECTLHFLPMVVKRQSNERRLAMGRANKVANLWKGYQATVSS